MTMKKYTLKLVGLLFCNLFCIYHVSAQQLSPYEKLHLMNQAVEVMRQIESQTIVYTSMQSNSDEVIQTKRSLDSNIDPEAQIYNDVFNGSKVIDYNQYFNILKNNNFDTWSFTWERVVLVNSANESAYIVKLYGKKSIHVPLKGVKITDSPCRAVFKVKYLSYNNYVVKLSILDQNTHDQDIAQAKDIAQLNSIQNIISVEDIVKKLAQDLSKNINSTVKNVDIQTFTYSNTGIVTEFSHKLTGLLRTQLTSINKSLDTRVSRQWGQEMKIVNKYQKTGNELILTSQWYNQQNQPKGTAFSVNMPFININDPNIIPNQSRIDTAQTINSVLVSDNYLPTLLSLEVTTNKGKGPQTFTENETMVLAVKVNKPCYVRLIYLDAIGRLTLLRPDDFKVIDTLLNKWVDVDQASVCSKPFGVERLIAFACPEAFDTLKTHQEDGYTIIDQTLEEVKKISTKARGMANKGIYVAEFFIPITTMPLISKK